MLRICLDARNVKPMPTGLGRYAFNLVRGLAELDSENEYIVLKNPSYTEKIVDRPNFREVPVPGDTSSMRSFLTAARVINRIEPDVFHALRHFVPLGVRCPRILITLLDIMWIEAPELAFTNPLKARYNKHIKGQLIRYAARRADVIIAISQATCQRAIDLLGVPPSKCRTIYAGLEKRFLTSEADPDPQAALRNGRRELLERAGDSFILSLGTSRPYKNVDGVIRAFGQIRERHPGVKLLVAGRGDRYAALRRLVAELELGERVVFWSSTTDGALTDDELRFLFSRARMLAFPSFLEGFGYPIVEAMATGCPVLTSNLSAPKEISGDAAVLVDPYDPRSIAAGMDRLLTDEGLRRRLVERGRRRAAQFSVEGCARSTLDLYTAHLRR